MELGNLFGRTWNQLGVSKESSAGVKMAWIVGTWSQVGREHGITCESEHRVGLAWTWDHVSKSLEPTEVCWCKHGVSVFVVGVILKPCWCESGIMLQMNSGKDVGLNFGIMWPLAGIRFLERFIFGQTWDHVGVNMEWHVG